MKAIVLAAGASTRLYPLTSSIPKWLLLVGGKTILEHQIESFIENGIDELIVVVGYKKETIIEFLSHKKYPLKITLIYNDSYEATGPIFGGLSLVRKYLSEQIIFSHCDVLFGTDALRILISSPHESAMLYKKGSWDEEAGKIIVDSNGRVCELGKHIKKEDSTGEYLQIAKLGLEFCRSLDGVLSERVTTKRDGYTIDVFNDVIQQKQTTAIGIEFGGLVMEIDTHEDYEKAKREWSK